jgi:hypothetical protein
MATIDSFAQLLRNKDTNLLKVGSGSGSVVWIDKRDPNVAYKVEKGNAVGDPNEDYSNAALALSNYDINATAVLCRIMEYTENKLEPVFNTYMSQVKRIVNPGFINPYRNVAAVVIFNYKTTNYSIIREKGMYYGVAEVEQLITRRKLLLLVEQYATTMAQLHYRSLLDGRDVELLLSTKNVDNEHVLYVSDFNVAAVITDHTDNTSVLNMVNSLRNAPTMKSDAELYNIFSTAYLAEATLVGKESEAQIVLNKLAVRI